MPLVPINKIIAKKFGNSPLSKSITASLVCEEFNNLIVGMWGKKIEYNAQAMYLKDKVLTVACLSSVVAQEIKMREEEILRALGSKFGKEEVEKLRLLM